MRALVLAAILLTASCAPALQRAVENAPAEGIYEPATLDTDRCREAVAGLEAKATEMQVAVVRIEIAEEGVWGATDYSIIFIKAGLNSCTELEVLAHEMAHVIEPVGLSPAQKEVFADAVSYEVTKKLGGYDPKARVVRYLSQHKLDARLISLYSREIAAAVEKITK